MGVSFEGAFRRWTFSEFQSPRGGLARTRRSQASDIEPMDDGCDFTLFHADDNALACFALETEARRAAKFIQAATEDAVGVPLPGPY